MNKILFFGEPLIRITPSMHNTIENNADCTMFYGGSEVNIARTIQGYGITTRLFTALPSSPVGDSFINFLEANGIETESICRKGNRVGLYYLENGFGIRNSEVYYDRKNTSIQDVDFLSIKMNDLFKDITHFHFSGITIAISSEVRNVLHILLKEAKSRDITISIDLNLRTKMISVEDAKRRFSMFAKYADYCFGIDPIMLDKEDIQMFNRDCATKKDIQLRMQQLQESYHFKGVFHTVRTIDEHNNNTYMCYALDTSFHTSTTLSSPVLERIGSGDAFVAGALYKLMSQKSMQEVADFAVASAVLKCTIPGDSMHVFPLQVEKLLQQSKGIVR